MNMNEVLTAYAGATASAVALAVGLTRVVTPGTILARLVPFASVASAGCVNVSLMRWKEIKDGVSIYRRRDGDPDGERIKVGDSPTAGRRAVAMTAASRVMTNSKSSTSVRPRPDSFHSTHNDSSASRTRVPAETSHTPQERSRNTSSGPRTDRNQSVCLLTPCDCVLPSDGRD